MAVCRLSSLRSRLKFELLVICILEFAVSGILTQTTVNGIPGGKTTLQCVYSTTGTLTVVKWYKGSEQIYQHYPDGAVFSFGTAKDRLSGTVFENVKTATLDISETQCPGDEGMYTCEVVVRGEGLEAILTQLIIKVDPSSPPTLTSQQLNDMGSTKFTCSGQLGRPAKGITWYRVLNGQQENRTSQAQSLAPVVNSDGCTYTGQSELNVDVSASDNGAQFMCMIGEKSASVSLTAASNPDITYSTTGPMPILDAATNSVEFVKGSQVQLVCSATGDPQPNFKWFFREEINNEKEARSGNRDNSSVLVLSNIKRAGYYECQASNILNQLNNPPSKTLRITLSVPASAYSADKTKTGSSTDNSGHVVGLAVGFTLCFLSNLVVVGLLIYVIRRPEKAMKLPIIRNLYRIGRNNQNNIQEYEIPERPSVSHHQHTEVDVHSSVEELAASDIEMLANIGNGHFGEVHKAILKSVVAVKVLKETCTEVDKNDFFREIETMQLLPQHKNVVAMLGYCKTAARAFLVLEYLGNGNLKSFLRKSRSNNIYGNLHGGSNKLTSKDLLSFSLDSAKGMAHIAKYKFLHRDLAARNILLSDNMVCKVSDFGLARDVINSREYLSRMETPLPIRWMSPESLCDGVYTIQSDVWSYGVLLWEIVTLGATPYPGIASGREQLREIQCGYRMEKPPHCTQEMYEIMTVCWNEEPEERPTFDNLVTSLRSLLDDEMTLHVDVDRAAETVYSDIDSQLVGEVV